MNTFWLGLITGVIASWALLTITLAALHGAQRSTPMATGHWEAEEDDIDRELHTITRDAA